jgi:DnaD/phage-associated family protein
MANPQPDQFTKLSNELYEAIMKTDFSKRQRNILDLVIRCSYGCRKKAAILRPSDFEAVGVLRGHIKKELDYLIMANVLRIEGEVYTLNKDYETWRVSIIKTFSDEKLQKILSRNLQQNVTETVTLVTEMVTESDEANEETVTEIVTKVTETVTDSLKESVASSDESYQNSNSTVTKTVTGIPSQPYSHVACGVPKDIIKDLKDLNTTTYIQQSNQDTGQGGGGGGQDFSYPRIFGIYEKHFTTDGKVTPFEVEELGILYDDYGGEWVLEAMREAVRHKKQNLAYVHGALKGFKSRGGPSKQTEETKNKASPGQEIGFYVVDDNDPITQRMRQAEALRHGSAAI